MAKAAKEPKITGIGGIFFFSNSPQEQKDWYTKNLGFEINTWGGLSFQSRNYFNPEKIEKTQWSLFKAGSKYFEPSSKDFMINYRVQNIEGMVERLKSNGVALLDEIQSTEFGKFVHLMDEEGNKIELWEPLD